MPEVMPQAPGAPAGSVGQSPPGSSPATTPVPNRGTEAAAMASLSIIVNALLKLAPELGVGTDIGRDALTAAQKLAKYVPPGSTSQGLENNAMMRMQREHMQQAPNAAIAAARQQAGAATTPPAAAAQPAAA